jgi:predicted  nucleic acid-binding Zn-ribbon protein
VISKVSRFQDDYRSWNEGRNKTIAEHESNFHTHLDNCFQQLEFMTSQILGCTDEELNEVAIQPHATQVLQSVKQTQDAFHALRIEAEDGLKKISTYSQEVFVKESGFYGLKEELQNMLSTVISERDQIDAARQQYWNEFEESQREYEDLDNKIREYDDLVGINHLKSRIGI